MNQKSANFLKIAWLAIFFIIASPGFASAKIVINEIFPNPSGTDTGLEWLELYNASSDPIALSNWQINAASGQYFTLPDYSFPANSFLLIHWRADGQNTANEIFTGTAAIDTNIANTSGFVALFNSSDHNKDTIVDYVEYGKAGQTWESTAAAAGIWPAGQFTVAAQENESLGLGNDGIDNNLIDDWQIFLKPTPGQKNIFSTDINTSDQINSQQQKNETETTGQNQTKISTSSQPILDNYSDKVLINEFMPNPSDKQKEWVELINIGQGTIDLSGWQIDDSAEQSEPQKIPQNTTILPNQFSVVELTKNILNNEGDEVRLLWPDGQLVHGVSYKNAPGGFSSARFGEGLWLWTDKPTPGQENLKPSQPSLAKKEALNQEPATLLASSLLENVSEAKNEQPLAISQTKQFEIPGQISDEKMAVPEVYAGINENITDSEKNAPKKNIILLILAVALIGLLTGIGFVILKRKNSIDPVEKSTTDYF